MDVSAPARDYYETLGLERDASAADVKRAFLRKARQLHPDVSDDPDAEAKFKEVNEAYSVLSDPRRRQNYDRFGDADGMGGFGSMDDLFSGFGSMSDLFSDFFGGGARQRRSGRGRDMAARIAVTLAEAATGTERTIAYDRLGVCDDCGGTGSADGETPHTCPACGGSGMRTIVQQTILGRMQTSAPCDVCHGTGTVVEHPCETCEGQGRVPTHEVVTVDVPVGVRDGETLRMAGLGEAGWRGEVAGDLVVEFAVAEDPRFVRRGDDLAARIDVDALEAILGCTVEVEGILEGESFLADVEAGSLEGARLRVEGRGMPRRGGGRGDFYGIVEVHPVADLTSEERETLSRVSRSHGGRIAPELEAVAEGRAPSAKHWPRP